MIRTGDRVLVGLGRGTADVIISDAALAARRLALVDAGSFAYPASQVPWQEIKRSLVKQFENGAILEGSDQPRQLTQTASIPRHNH